MGRIPEYLRRAAPHNDNPWRIVLAASLCVFFLLSLLIDVRGDGLPPRMVVVAGFTLVTAVSTAAVAYLFPLIFRRFYEPARWKVWKALVECLLILVFISIGNSLFYLAFLDGGAPVLKVFTDMAWLTVVIGIIPFVLVSYISRNAELKRSLENAVDLNSRLSAKAGITAAAESEGEDKILLAGTTKECLEVAPEDILYAESAGNYITVHYLGGNTPRSGRIRSTVSAVESQLAGFPYIVRCHRAFLVNLEHVSAAEGGSQGLLLTLPASGSAVPVSRSYLKAVKKRLADHC